MRRISLAGFVIVMTSAGWLVLASQAGAQQVPLRSAPELAEFWSKLDSARRYQFDSAGLGFTTGAPGSLGRGKPLSEIIPDWTDESAVEPPIGSGMVNAKDLVLLAIGDFRGAVSNPNFPNHESVLVEARQGLAETTSEFLAGQALVANDLLVNALRQRFPGGTGDSGDDGTNQTALLDQSLDEARLAISSAVDNLRQFPEGFRASGIVDPFLPWVVENTLGPGQTQRDRVPNEFYRFTEVVDLNATAGVELGRRIFFLGNVADEDVFPFGNFPSEEDLNLGDPNRLDASGREQAAEELKKSAQETYMNSAVLAALQTPEEFEHNQGNQLKRRVLDASRVFDDIIGGLNPLQMIGDFVPFGDVEDFLADCDARIEDAGTAESAAAAAIRDYDETEIQLAAALGNLQTDFVAEMESTTGFPVGGSCDNGPSATCFDLTNADPSIGRLERQRLLDEAAEFSLVGRAGALRQAQLALEEAILGVTEAKRNLDKYPELIRIEEKRNSAVAKVTTASGATIAALTFGEQMSEIAMLTTVAFPPSVNLTLDPGAIIRAGLSQAKEIVTLTQGIRVEGINSAATVKALLVEESLALVAVEKAKNSQDQAQIVIDEAFARLERLAREFVVSQAETAGFYFANPSFRLDRDRALRSAEIALETAMSTCYTASQMLEYEWSEEYSNIIRDPGGVSPAVSLPPVADPFPRAESLFSVVSAGSPQEQSLTAFFASLNLWDSALRNTRGDNPQPSTRIITLKNNILKFNRSKVASDPEFAQMAQNTLDDFIKESLVPNTFDPLRNDLQFEFSTHLADQSMFRFEPNTKIASIEIRLLSKPGESLVPGGAYTLLNAPIVDLVMNDEASIRTFFADPLAGDDDLITYTLRGSRSLNLAPFRASVEACVRDHPFTGLCVPSTNENIELQNFSPAVTRWTLWVQTDDGGNEPLQFENLEDIQIVFHLVHGVPRGSLFPGQ
jgi:hypothetical protein